jgi:S-disulfanyl-L-cysteine oxidoreductase SoxD
MGPYRMRWCKEVSGNSKRYCFILAMAALTFPCSLFPVPLHAQSPTYGVGRKPTEEEVRAMDIGISPSGKELPPGHGTAKEGAQLFMQKGCAGCHGASGSGGKAPILIKRDNPPKNTPCLSPCITDNTVMSLHSPYATVLWDYIHRGMPFGKEGSLKPDEVYSIVAFLLYKNGVIKEDEVMDQQSLPKVNMPNRNGFAPVPDWKHGQPRLAGYP